MTIPLIDKQDNFEIVGLQIAAILAQETIDQQALALTAGKDPVLWEFGVYSERFNPWEVFQDNPDGLPIVNVAYDTSNFREGGVVSHQKDDANYNIDVYTSVSASNNVAGGHNPGDESTALALHRVIRLVRNIIMHPDNTYLKLTRVVGAKTGNLIGKRWINSKEKFQPQIGDRPGESVIACRISLAVTFNETPVNEEFPELEVVGITAKRAIDGKIILEADFDTT